MKTGDRFAAIAKNDITRTFVLEEIDPFDIDRTFKLRDEETDRKSVV